MTDRAVEADRGRAVESLERGLAAELDMLAELLKGLTDQREAIAADDTAKLESLGLQLGRTLITLREARRQRGILIELIVGQGEARLSELLGCLPTEAGTRIRQLSVRLRQLAVGASRELAVNQTVIRRSIESGERLLHHLLTSPTTASYGQRDTGGREGLLLNQRA